MSDRQQVKRFVTTHALSKGIQEFDGYLRDGWFSYNNSALHAWTSGTTSDARDGVDAFASLDDAKRKARQMVIDQQMKLEKELSKLNSRKKEIEEDYGKLEDLLSSLLKSK